MIGQQRQKAAVSEQPPSIEWAIAAVERWFDSMRGAGGYGGPVAHWWQDSLSYTGPGLDWRYDGIIGGYLNLFRETSAEIWLEKARRAGDDLVNGQLPAGNYRNSAFERNPQSGGTPHEPACDLALLRLAMTLRAQGGDNWQRYADGACLNLEQFVLGVLWDSSHQRLSNTAGDPSFVPNKAATTVEALFAWAVFAGDEAIITRHCLPILDTIVDLQVRDPGSAVDGAIPQAVTGAKANERYFPYYIARCIPALLRGYEVSHEERYLQTAKRAMSFILRYQENDGAFPQVVYGRGNQVNQYPQWIAGVGDMLRAMALLQPFHDNPLPLEPSLNWLLRGVQGNGSIRTARGFASQVKQRAPAPLPDFRDVLGICGWADKAFYFLTSCPQAAHVIPAAGPLPRFSTPCSYRGRPAIMREDERQLEVRQGRQTLYRWVKGADWAEVLV